MHVKNFCIIFLFITMTSPGEFEKKKKKIFDQVQNGPECILKFFFFFITMTSPGKFEKKKKNNNNFYFL